ncbi:Hypothetical predicted protein [Mytilus galloprovincialis]|uniref:Uncharacterized protein n=1 Tax=Mytilus galloprovincialis TaxID=29158 RepID=A0A8B6BRV9_MYTGA|nr:Hypothetical predicted protein [Mytilus galloprovincialis]
MQNIFKLISCRNVEQKKEKVKHEKQICTEKGVQLCLRKTIFLKTDVSLTGSKKSMTSSQSVECELLCQRMQVEDGTALSQRDTDLSQRSDSVILIEEGIIKKELDVDDLSQDCSLLTERLPDVINQQQMNHVDCLRMRNSLTEILEEVKLRRNNDLENEERIRHLVQEKYEMERKLDGEKCHFASLSEEHDKKVAEIKRQFEDKIKVLKAEVKQNQVFKDCGQKETKSLKDDIRSLQITNYNLEKKLREQGRKLQLQTSSTNQHLKQLSSAEEKFQTISTYCKKISESQDRLSRNGKSACFNLKNLPTLLPHYPLTICMTN